MCANLWYMQVTLTSKHVERVLDVHNSVFKGLDLDLTVYLKSAQVIKQTTCGSENLVPSLKTSTNFLLNITLMLCMFLIAVHFDVYSICSLVTSYLDLSPSISPLCHSEKRPCPNMPLIERHPTDGILHDHLISRATKPPVRYL